MAGSILGCILGLVLVWDTGPAYASCIASALGYSQHSGTTSLVPKGSLLKLALLPLQDPSSRHHLLHGTILCWIPIPFGKEPVSENYWDCPSSGLGVRHGRSALPPRPPPPGGSSLCHGAVGNGGCLSIGLDAQDP